MRATYKTTIALAGLLTLTTLSLGCVEADPSLVLTVGIVGELDSTSAMDGDTCPTSCEYEFGGNNGIFVGSAAIDLARLEQYGQFPYRQPGTFKLTFAMENRLQDSTANDGSGLRSDSNDIAVDRFNVVWKTTTGKQLYAPGGDESDGVRRFYIYVGSDGDIVGGQLDLLSGAIFPDGTNNEAAFLRGALQEEFPNIGSAPSEVIVEIQAVGKSNDGSRVESQVVRFPISICDGCQVFDTALSYCCDDPGNIDSASCPVFAATPMCAPGG